LDKSDNAWFCRLHIDGSCCFLFFNVVSSTELVKIDFRRSILKAISQKIAADELKKASESSSAFVVVIRFASPA